MQAALLVFAASGFHHFGATMCFAVVVESVALNPGLQIPKCLATHRPQNLTRSPDSLGSKLRLPVGCVRVTIR